MSKPMPHLWLTRLILIGLGGFGIFSTSIYLPSLPAMTHYFGTTQGMVQLTLTVFFLGSALGQLYLGPLSDYFGRLKVGYAGITLFILSTLGCAFANSIESLIFARFIQGVAASTGPLLARAISRDLFSGADLTRMLSTVMLVISLSPAIAPAIGGYLHEHFGWQASFYFLATITTLILILKYSYLPETNKNLKKNDIHFVSILKDYRKLFEAPQFSGYCLALCGTFGGLFIFITMSPFIFISHFQWAESDYGLVTAMMSLGNILGFSISNRIAGKFHPHHMIHFGCGCMILSCLSLIVIELSSSASALNVMVFIVCYMASSAFAIVNSSSSGMNMNPHNAGVAAAFLGAVQIGSGAISSVIASLLSDSVLVLSFTMVCSTLFGYGGFLFFNVRRKPFSLFS